MKLFYKTEDGDFQEVGGITNAEITFSNEKDGADIDLINCNHELTAQLDKKIYEMIKCNAPTKAVYTEYDFDRVLCWIKEGYSPFKNVKCRTCKDKGICVKDRINQFYKKERNF